MNCTDLDVLNNLWIQLAVELAVLERLTRFWTKEKLIPITEICSKYRELQTLMHTKYYY